MLPQLWKQLVINVFIFRRPIILSHVELRDLIDCLIDFDQSEVEETIERIKIQTGVEGYVICNKQGQVRSFFSYTF